MIRQRTNNIEKFGAGEGIRTLDPNLGKVITKVCARLLAIFPICQRLENRRFLFDNFALGCYDLR